MMIQVNRPLLPFKTLDWAVTLLVGALAAGLAWPQIFPDPEHANEANLPNFSKRATMLQGVTDPIQRDQLCIGLSAYGRQLDRVIPKDAHVFLSGVVGKEHGGKLGYYYFLRNYLFPREVEISVDRKAVFLAEGFEGTDAKSPEELRAKGFDLLLKIGEDDRISIMPLTERGTPKP